MKAPGETHPAAAAKRAPFVAIEHVQMAMPCGREDAAREFYTEILEMTELAKPEALAKRGGCWFESGKVEIHLGVEQDFRPAKKAHPALRCADFDFMVARLRCHGIAVEEQGDIAGVRRCHFHDCFGNRIELISG